MHVWKGASFMRYPDLDPGVGTQRHARAIKQLRVGDIVEAWLDCTPDPGRTRPLPIVIVGVPGLRETTFAVKDLFSDHVYPMNFAYQWRCAGHINGLEEVIGADRVRAAQTGGKSPYPQREAGSF